jgi:serine/threonine protein kinase
LNGKTRHADFNLDFVMKEQIGKGGFSEVFRCEEMRTSNVFAVKKMKRTKLSERDITFLREEVRMLQLVNKHSERVIHMFDFYEVW